MPRIEAPSRAPSFHEELDDVKRDVLWHVPLLIDLFVEHGLPLIHICFDKKKLL